MFLSTSSENKEFIINPLSAILKFSYDVMARNFNEDEK
jgi:hypothetical protein